MKRKLLSTFLILFTTGLLLLTACGDSSPPAPVNITIEMDEFSFLVHEFDLMDFKVGQEVTLTLINNGMLEHEIMFGRNIVDGGNGMPMGYGVDLFEYTGVEPIVMMPEMGGDEENEEEMQDDEHAEEEMEHDDEGESDGHGDSGFMVTLASGGDGYTIQFTITEEMIGDWEIGCFLLEGVHYTSGMYLPLKVSS